jgi:hypothetical protein
MESSLTVGGTVTAKGPLTFQWGGPVTSRVTLCKNPGKFGQEFKTGRRCALRLRAAGVTRGCSTPVMTPLPQQSVARRCTLPNLLLKRGSMIVLMMEKRAKMGNSCVSRLD